MAEDLIVQKDVEGGHQLEMFEKSHGEEMTMTQFAQWVESNLAGTGVVGALQIGALMLCCDVIAQDISKATFRYRQLLENGTSKIVDPRKNDMAAFLKLEPNRRHTWRNFIEMMVYWSCLTDNAYAGVIRANDDTVLELIPFQTGRVQEKIFGRDVYYEVTASTMQEQALLGSSFRVFAERDMIHVRTRMLDGMDGYSTLTAGRKTLEIMNNLSDYRKNLFGEEGQMRGVFTRDNLEPIPEEIFQRLRQQFKILMNKFRTLTEPIVLEGGVKFNTISSNPKEMELAAQFEAQINEVCRLFRMPPHKIFLLSGSKYENLETQEKMYVGDTLIPRAEAFEEQFAKTLLSRKDRLGFFYEFDRNEMTLRDTKAETERTIKALERGAITRDEARAVFGYNPLPGEAGQTFLIPVNMAVVNDKNEVLIGGASTPTDDSKTEDPEQETEETPAEKAVALRIVK
ncbi:phage portal protein [Rhizobium azibense]|uniref:HK97 family phage portal protein n=1 Tax=Rhizobium azibense TaxID=1136135 RepID=A0A4R3RF27_9HYPH|nr:phage portal protein [Rhizobium azibense]TCU34153.1 HK97 family phage portal protein [Rhizobium azibense]